MVLKYLFVLDHLYDFVFIISQFVLCKHQQCNLVHKPIASISRCGYEHKVVYCTGSDNWQALYSLPKNLAVKLN